MVIYMPQYHPHTTIGQQLVLMGIFADQHRDRMRKHFHTQTDGLFASLDLAPISDNSYTLIIFGFNDVGMKC